MLGSLRKQKIVQLVKKQHQLSINELARLLDVTPNTIRVDLRELEEHKEIVRVWGGVISATPNEPKESEDIFDTRNTKNIHEKKYIAQQTIGLFQGRAQISIFLDSSSTSLEVARAIKNPPHGVVLPAHIVVITNFYKIALELSNIPSISVILCGGLWWAQEHSCIGSDTLAIIQHYHVDVAILSCAGIQIDEGIFNGNYETTPIKQLMQKNSSEVWLLCDHSKIGRKALSFMFPFSQIHKLITNQPLAQDWQEFLQKSNVQIIT
ncbi:MAG: DeoR/GlpR family DNA-binding transcription regulator [Brevinema sp.]